MSLKCYVWVHFNASKAEELPLEFLFEQCYEVREANGLDNIRPTKLPNLNFSISPGLKSGCKWLLAKTQTNQICLAPQQEEIAACTKTIPKLQTVNHKP